jgi:hypothetical protein
MAPVVAFVAAAVAKITVAAVVKFVVTTAFSIGVSRLLAKRAIAKAQAGGDGGGRVQLPPATDNKIPVVYGSAFLGGAIIDAYLTPDQKTMYYAVALTEVTDNGEISYGDIYYDGKLCTFGSDGAGGTTKVTQLINNATSPSQTDTRINGYLNIYLYKNGSTGATSGTNTTENAYDVMPSWGSSTYAMTNCAFAIIKVKYSTDAGTTGLGGITAQIKNTETGQSTGVFRPGTAIKDYMTNTRYGCAIPLSQVDTISLDDLNTYSSQTISVTGGPSPTQARYTINGPIDTAQNCLTNLQYLVDSCDSWLQYSELTGKWKVVINKAYTQAPNAQTTNDLFIVNSSNLVGGIEISPIDLNETYNQVEVAYPNFNVKDQTDYQIIDLFDTDPNLLSQNEAINRLNITLPLVNNAVQAKYLAARRIFQSREDLVITFRTDYSGIQVEAGDVVRVYHETYGWDASNGFPDGKLFRVSEVIEEKDINGNLFASFRAFEYNATVYVDDPVEDFTPAFNTGLKDPNIISQPGTPVITPSDNLNGQITSFNVTSYVPDSGLVLYMDFNYGNSSNVLEHVLYRTLQQSDGVPFVPSPDVANANVTSVSINVNDLTTGNYYWSVTARNNTSGRRSNSSAEFKWLGANVIAPIEWNVCNASSNGNLITTDAASNILIYSNITLLSGNGTFASNTYIDNVISNTQFTVTPTPTVAISNACLQIQSQGVRGTQVQSNTVTYTNVNNSANPNSRLKAIAFNVADLAANTVTLPIPIATAVVPRPVYIDGTTVDANYYVPYYSGTSSTANGYFENSTAPYEPAYASFQALSEGDEGWYYLIYGPPTISLNDQENLILSLEATLTSNVDSIVQISHFYATANSYPSGIIYRQTTADSVYIVMGDTPYQAQLNYQFQAANNNPIVQAGFIIRNIIGNTRVTIPTAYLDISKARFPPP